MSFGTEHIDRASRRILAGMIVCGTMLTGLSFAMQMDPGAVKSRLTGLMGQVDALVSSAEAPSR